jgi:TPR repeat protein
MVLCLKYAARLVAVASALVMSGCATKSVETAQVPTCSGHGVGFSAPPSAETKAAIAAHNDAGKLSTEALIEKVAVGDVAAQIELGLRYANGDRAEKNGERAVALFQAAADQGNALGQYFLGTAYSHGLGLEQNDIPAVALWEESSRSGYSHAQYWLGIMVANGFGGIQKNWCAAVPLFEAAAEELPDAAFMLGTAYHQGELGSPNYDEAAKWYRKATSKILNQKAQYNLRLLIEAHLVMWQPGDPGKPVPPPEKGASHDSSKKLKLHIIDPATQQTG